MHSLSLVLTLSSILLAGTPAYADSHTADTADTADAATVAEEVERDENSRTHIPPPPIGLRFGQPLDGERFRVAYRYERIQKQGLLVGDNHISPSQVFGGVPPSPVYIRAPRKLDISVHTFELAYAPHPRFTLIAEVPLLKQELETLDEASGLYSEVETDGIGDVAFALVVPFIRKGNESSHFHLAFDIPTGSIRRGGDMRRHPFDLQQGNGTFDLEWGVSYQGHRDWFVWGGQIFGQHPVGDNDLNYREGSRFEASGWVAARLVEGLSFSLRMDWQKWNNIRVNDRVDNASLEDPSDNPKARGGYRLTLSPGMTLIFPELPNQQLAVEVGVPFYQDLDGPQLETDWSVKAGWQWGF